MKGHTAQRGKTWTYWVDADRDEAGKRKQITKGGFPTEREARKALNLLMVDLDRGTHVETTKQTVAAFMREWLPSSKGRVKPSTWATYRSLTEKQIIPALGGIALQSLTPARLNSFYADLLDHGRLHGKGTRTLSPRTVGHIHATLRLALSEAVRWQLLARNPADQASPPRKQKPSLVTWNAEEARTFLASVRDDRLFAAYALSLTTGLRRGELLGFAWRDVDLDAGWLNVRQTIVSVDFKVLVSTPKTQAGRRSIAVDSGTVEILRDHRIRQLKERHELGIGAVKPDDLVFSNLAGEPLHPALFSDAFNRRVKRAEVPRIRLHDVRHTYATLSLAMGVSPKVVAERLGHSSVAITLDLYSHSVPSLQQDAAAKVAALIL